LRRKLSAEEKAELKREFFEKAAAGFERMFGEGTLDKYRTFVQKDEKAYEIAGELWQWMMEKHIEKDDRAVEVEAKRKCPWCGGIAMTRKGKVEGEQETREVIGSLGGVGFEREGFYCGRCRKVFFPSGPAA